MVDHQSAKSSTLTYNPTISDALLDHGDRSIVCNIVNINNAKHGDVHNGSKYIGEPHVKCGPKHPPDGGLRAWLVVFSSFLCNGILFGIINTYGIIYVTLQERMTQSGDTDASSKAGMP